MSPPVAQQSSPRKSSLSREAIAALGNVSPALAWEQIKALVQQAIQEYSRASLEAAQIENLPTDLETLAGSMESWKPVAAINYLVESNPAMSLREIPKLAPLRVLKAVLHMLMTNDRLLSP